MIIADDAKVFEILDRYEENQNLVEFKNDIIALVRKQSNNDEQAKQQEDNQQQKKAQELQKELPKQQTFKQATEFLDLHAQVQAVDQQIDEQEQSGSETDDSIEKQLVNFTEEEKQAIMADPKSPLGAALFNKRRKKSKQGIQAIKDAMNPTLCQGIYLRPTQAQQQNHIEKIPLDVQQTHQQNLPEEMIRKYSKELSDEEEAETQVPDFSEEQQRAILQDPTSPLGNALIHRKKEQKSNIKMIRDVLKPIKQ